jgi:hypothetical protein
MRFTDFIADVVDNIRQRVTATAFTDNGDGTFTVSVPGLMDLEAGSFVIIDGTEYKVISIDSNNSTFDIEATAAPGDYVVKCAHPYYLHGTALAVDAELRQTFNGWKKYPLVFLNESINRREDASETAQVRETYSARLFFCALGDYENMLTEDFYDEIIDPLNIYVDNFITTLKFSGSVFWKQVGTFDRIDHPKWGLEIVDKGKTTNIFNDKLSAVELVMDIPMSRAWSPCKYRKPELRFTSCRTINPTYVTVNGDAFEEAANGGTIDVVVRYDTLGPIGTIVGNEVIIPDPSGGPCSDATVTVNGSAWGTIPSGGTGNIPVRNTAGTQVGSKVGSDWIIPNDAVTNSDASVTVSDIVQGVTRVLSDITVTVKNSENTTVKSETSPALKNVTTNLNDITFTDTDNTTSSKAAGVNFSATLIPALSAAQLNDVDNGLTFTQKDSLSALLDIKTGQTISYRTGDDGDIEQGSLLSFVVLSAQNPYGNSNRFTDTLGGQTYADGIIVDWSRRLMWYNPSTTANWNTSIDAAEAATTGGFTDWHIPNVQQAQSIMNYGNSGGMLNYTPFNLSFASMWTSTTSPDTTTNAYRMLTTGATTAGGISQTGKSVTANYMYCRIFSLSDLGL